MTAYEHFLVTYVYYGSFQGRELDISEKTNYLVFMINAFQVGFFLMEKRKLSWLVHILSIEYC